MSNSSAMMGHAFAQPAVWGWWSRPRRSIEFEQGSDYRAGVSAETTGSQVDLVTPNGAAAGWPYEGACARASRDGALHDKRRHLRAMDRG